MSDLSCDGWENSTLNLHRPFRPRQPADQAGDDQPQPSGAEEQLQGDDRQAEDSKVVTANGDAAAGQRQQRSVRRRRQRNSESSTSKVSLARGFALPTWLTWCKK